MAQVGLGKELHSIIGQGKVESFLAGKPEDRRSQIEEAAGLGTFKRRRERAELKLREVRRNLERADLLEREVGSQLAPLRRQASAAEQLRAVEAGLAETRGRLLTGEVGGVDAELARAPGRARGHRRSERARCEEGLEELAAARAARGRGVRAPPGGARAARQAAAARARARRAPRERPAPRGAAPAPARGGGARLGRGARAPARRAGRAPGGAETRTAGRRRSAAWPTRSRPPRRRSPRSPGGSSAARETARRAPREPQPPDARA